MSISERIAPFLPRLRRYAFAVTGSRSSGDAYVAATLEAVIADISIYPDTSSDCISLFRLCAELINCMKLDTKRVNSPLTVEHEIAGDLTALPVKLRQAFLLAYAEGFSLGETAEILNFATTDVEKMLVEAVAKISGPGSAELIVLHGDSETALDMNQYIKDNGQQVAGVVRTLRRGC